MDLLISFKEFIAQQKLFHAKDRLLLAVSGGVDSVVLCELCKQAGFNFSIAHCNFGLRGEESERDEIFVKGLALDYSIPLFTRKFDTEHFANENKLSIQEAARHLRYQWFDALLAEMKPTKLPAWLLTAHHADDNVETVLMNFFKGSGINGLKGIEPKREKIIRPLLFANKKTILDFAKNNNLRWVDDSSNELDKYTRNYIRQQVLPAVEKIYPTVRANIMQNITRYKEATILYKEAIDRHHKKLLTYSGEEVHIPILKLKKANPVGSILYELLVPYGFTPKQTGEVLELLDSETGKMVYSATHRIFKNRDWLIIASKQQQDSNHIFINEADKEVIFEAGKLRITHCNDVPQNLSHGNEQLLVDASLVQFPLLLRRWKTGDYFYPLGMRKKKKISRFLIDQKISKIGKEKTWVLEMDKKVVWVVGMRMDDRFKITDSTRQLLRIILSK